MKIDCRAIGLLMMEISDRVKLIMDEFPSEHGEHLRHLAVFSIHTAIFMRSIYKLNNGDEISKYTKSEIEFFKECGCDFKKV